ncbi:hypothetical protein YC2023_107563 [Brassica napus]
MAWVDCSNLARSSSPSFPYYRDWNFGVDSNQKPKICLWGFCKVLAFMIRALLCVPQICITTSTSAGLDQILQWMFYHKCMQSIVHGVKLDDVARLLNRARNYSAKSMENEMLGEAFKKLQNPYEIVIVKDLNKPLIIAAKTNMEVLLEVVEEEAKLVVAKPQRQ